MPKLEQMPEQHVYQAYGIYLLAPEHRFVKRLREVYEPSSHGYKTWQSSFVLMDYLQHRPPRKRARVMEIGCGWGAAAVYCAKRFRARVTGVDGDRDVFPFLEMLASLNDVKVAVLHKRLERLTARRLGEEDVLIGSDICFWDRLVKPMTLLVNRALLGGVERVVIADPGRSTFYEFAERCSRRWQVELTEWYASDPRRACGEVLEVRNRTP